jgi:hypothetical protein
MLWFLSTASVPTFLAGVHVLVWLAATYGYTRCAFLTFAVGVGEARRAASGFGWVLAAGVLAIDPLLRWWGQHGMVGWLVAYLAGATVVPLALAFRSWYVALDYAQGLELHARAAGGLTRVESARMHRGLQYGEPTRVLGSQAPRVDVTVHTTRRALGAARAMIGR